MRRPLPGTFPVDFNVYWSAASLVRHGAASRIYTGADTGGDPQKAIAAPNTPIFHEAAAQGLGFVGLYVYPPLLADLLVPYTLLPLRLASQVWLFSNLLFLLLTGVLVAWLLDVKLRSGAAVLVLLSIFCFTPVLQTLHDGQITIFLLLLWTAGTWLYREGRFTAAGGIFALATAIKLTPLLVIVPFVLWRRWKLLGAFTLTLMILGGLCLAVDTPHTTSVYFTRVMPAMSGSIPYITNFSLSAATARWLTLLYAGTVSGYPVALPVLPAGIGRIVPVLILVSVIALLLRSREHLDRSAEVLTLGLLSLLAPILSPVSWFHAYAMSFVAFALLWQNAVRAPHIRPLPLAALTLVSLLLGSAVSENVLTLLNGSLHYAPLATWLQLGQLLVTVALIFYQLWRVGPPAAV